MDKNQSAVSKNGLKNVLIVLLVFFLSVTVLGLQAGVFNFRGDAVFQENIQVLGTMSGASDLRIQQGIDYLDLNENVIYSTFVDLPSLSMARSLSIPEDFNFTFVFQRSNALSPFNISFVFWDALIERPTLVLNGGLSGRASTFDRSLQVGKNRASGDVNNSYNVCGGTTLADCDTPATGADLVVEDDIEAFGSIQAHENLFVDGNAFFNSIYGSMFQFQESTLIIIPGIGTDVNVTGFDAGASNGFVFFDDEALTLDENGTYLVNWSASIINGNKRNFRIAVAVNDVLQEQTAGSADSQANLITNISGSGMISLTEGDVITMFIANLDSTDNVVIEYANLSLVRIGN